MFTINEVPVENKRSVFPRMFCYLAKSITDVCGRSGEGAVREAVRNFASDRAYVLKKKHRDAGLKTNVRSYVCASDFPMDTRMRDQIITLNEEVCIRDHFTCPYANIWASLDAGETGMWFCEEYEKAKFEAYTDGIGQMHMSESLTEKRNNACHFAMYFRKANITEEEADMCFTDEREVSAEDAETADGFYITEGEQCLGFYYHLTGVLNRRYGEEGLCAISEGLKALAGDMIDVMKEQAVRMLKPFDGDFAKDNFPFPLSISDDLYVSAKTDLSDELKKRADMMLDNLLLAPIAASLS